MLRALSAVIALCVFGLQASAADDWNLFGPQHPTYADGATAPTAGLETCEPVEWNLFCPLGFVGDAPQADEWNFLQASFSQAKDDRPVVKCLCCAGCTVCQWYKNRGDADLPYRLEFLDDDAVGHKKDANGDAYGWPVFEFPGRGGQDWHVWNIGADVQSLTARWKQLGGH